MKKILLLFVLISCFLMNSIGVKQEINNNLIPREVFFGNPDVMNVQLSPDGKKISYCAEVNGAMNLFYATRANPGHAVQLTSDELKGVRKYHWTYTPDVLIYAQDHHGDENDQLFVVTCSSKEVVPIPAGPGSVMHLEAMSHHAPEKIIISSNERCSEYFDLYSYDLIKKDKKLFFENQKNYASFVLDQHLNLIFASQVMPSGDLTYWLFDNNKQSEPELWLTVPFEDVETTAIIAVTSNREFCYLLDSRQSDCSQLWKIHIKTGERFLIAQDAYADISDCIFDPVSQEIQAYAAEYLRTQWTSLDHEFQVAWNALIKQFSQDADVSIRSRSYDNNYWIVLSDQPSQGLSYYLYDTKSNQLTYLFDYRRKLKSYQLNHMEPVIIKARDGLEMVSYLTLPDQRKINSLQEGSSFPLILNVHGGPVARDSYGYDPVHQWLSNRGFAVLSVNYRSSSGFGKSFIRSGDGEWGRKMHEDILDAAQWAIDHQITTKDSIGIYGGSYGGYEVLVALSMTPDFFQCGVDIVGPSHLETLFKTIPPYWDCFVALERRRFGLPHEPSPLDQAILNERSPLMFVNQIRKPILIAQGANDVRVKQSEADQMVNAMRQNQIPYTYLLFHNEGHGFVQPENKFAFYSQVELFLNQVFQSRYEPIANELRNADVTLEFYSPGIRKSKHNTIQ